MGKTSESHIRFFKLDNIIIIGASLGSYLAPRAATFEKRIKKVICWSIFPDFYDVVRESQPKYLKISMDLVFTLKIEGRFNSVFNN